MTRRIAVTGVASGIGAELAARLTARGDAVIGFDIRPTTENIAQFVPLDLNDPNSIDAAISALEAPLDGLCNNAGLPPRDGMAAEVLQVNFIGARRLTEGLAPHLRDGASVVNIASRAGAKWPQNLDQVLRLGAVRDSAALEAFVDSEGLDPTRAYNLSKEAMILWTAALTEEMIGRGVRINSVSPGAVATGILDDFARAFGDKMTRNVARAGRAGTPAEIAQVAAFLLSEESAWIKGIDLAVDGGMGGFNMADQLGLAALCAAPPQA